MFDEVASGKRLLGDVSLGMKDTVLLSDSDSDPEDTDVSSESEVELSLSESEDETQRPKKLKLMISDIIDSIGEHWVLVLPFYVIIYISCF